MPTAASRPQPTVSLAVFDGGHIAVEQLQLPDRHAGDIDVTITTAALCGSDLHTVRGHRPSPARTALGHEGIGTVTDVDENTADLNGQLLQVGDRVVFGMMASCGTCDRCRVGLTMKCRSLLKYGHTSVTTPPHATGTLATRVRLRGVPVIRVPDDADDLRLVSAGCAVATAAAIVAAAGDPSGERVLVLGAGAVGVYSTAMFATLGNQVRIKDPTPERRRVAEQLGASPYVADDTRFPVVVEASGNAMAVADAVQACDVGGHVILAGSVSPGSSTVRLDPAEIVTRLVRITGIHNYTAENFRWGVRWLLAQGDELDLTRFLSPPVSLSELETGLKWMDEGLYLRVIAKPETPEGPGLDRHRPLSGAAMTASEDGVQ